MCEYLLEGLHEPSLRLMSWLGGMVATANEPKVNSRMITTDEISMAAGNCRLGALISIRMRGVHLDTGEQQDDAREEGDIPHSGNVWEISGMGMAARHRHHRAGVRRYRVQHRDRVA